MKKFKFIIVGLLTLSLIAIGCGDDDDTNIPDQGQTDDGDNDDDGDGDDGANFVGAVYAMTNGNGQIDGNVQDDNVIVAYGAYALTKTPDNSTLLAVNAGDNTISSFNINDDFSLTLAGTPQPTGAIGPNSIAFTPIEDDQMQGYVYVTNITRPEFLSQGEPAQQGTVTGNT